MNHAMHPGQQAALRWILSCLVIGGVLAMHVLGGHDMGRARPMSMAPVGIAALNAAGPEMSLMNMPAAAHPPIPASQSTIAVPVPDADDMSDMSCCVLFLVTSAALALLAPLATARGDGRLPFEIGRSGHALSWHPGPPEGAPPRFSLGVLRV